MKKQHSYGSSILHLNTWFKVLSPDFDIQVAIRNIHRVLLNVQRYVVDFKLLSLFDPQCGSSRNFTSVEHCEPSNRHHIFSYSGAIPHISQQIREHTEVLSHIWVFSFERVRKPLLIDY